MRIKSSQKFIADVCCFSDDDLWLGGDENTLEKQISTLIRKYLIEMKKN